MEAYDDELISDLPLSLMNHYNTSKKYEDLSLKTIQEIKIKAIEYLKTVRRIHKQSNLPKKESTESLLSLVKELQNKCAEQINTKLNHSRLFASELENYCKTRYQDNTADHLNKQLKISASKIFI